jgi:LmbE family N-acetylglucosaminyl deacetylase
VVAVLDPGRLGPTLVVAPHPDDESIGCGGLIACLRSRAVEVSVVIVTDGSGSHPASRDFPPAQLAALRAAEALAALRILGVQEHHAFYLGQADRFVPAVDAPGFDDAVAEAGAMLRRLRPSTLVIPSPADAHGDHQAVATIWRRAAATVQPGPRLLEYLVWPAGEGAPKGDPLRLDIAEFLPRKRLAVAAHRSQLGLAVTDDPHGFVLPPALLARADDPIETYYERPG